MLVIFEERASEKLNGDILESSTSVNLAELLSAPMLTQENLTKYLQTVEGKILSKHGKLEVADFSNEDIEGKQICAVKDETSEDVLTPLFDDEIYTLLSPHRNCTIVDNTFQVRNQNEFMKTVNSIEVDCEENLTHSNVNGIGNAYILNENSSTGGRAAIPELKEAKKVAGPSEVKAHEDFEKQIMAYGAEYYDIGFSEIGIAKHCDTAINKKSEMVCIELCCPVKPHSNCENPLAHDSPQDSTSTRIPKYRSVEGNRPCSYERADNCKSLNTMQFRCQKETSPHTTTVNIDLESRKRQSPNGECPDSLEFFSTFEYLAENHDTTNEQVQSSYLAGMSNLEPTCMFSRKSFQCKSDNFVRSDPKIKIQSACPSNIKQEDHSRLPLASPISNSTNVRCRRWPSMHDVFFGVHDESSCDEISSDESMKLEFTYPPSTGTVSNLGCLDFLFGWQSSNDDDNEYLIMDFFCQWVLAIVLLSFFCPFLLNILFILIDVSIDK
jgi:hypothetical protein